jgi:acetoacetyl-CoA synthetase
VTPSERTTTSVLWSPSAELRGSCALQQFASSLPATLHSYEELHEWSVAHPQQFWSAAARFLLLAGEGELSPAFEALPSPPTPLARAWFPKFALNFAENLLCGDGDDASLAIVSRSEGVLARRYTRGDLIRDVAAVAHYLRTQGVTRGDKVFAYLPNIPEAVVCMLATSALGATWSSCGTDYQVEGVRSRVERVQPKVFITARSFLWRGERRSLEGVTAAIQREFSSVQSVLEVNYLGSERSSPAGWDSYEDLIRSPAPPLLFERFPFSHPLYIMFSSGTTGKPKGIVHGAGGTLLEHKKEHILHGDLRTGDRLFYQTSTSWMMWNWLVSGLASGAAIVLFDGDPLLEEGFILWRIAEEEQITHFGTSAAFLGALEKQGCEPGKRHQLGALRVIFSTGSTLFPSQFDFVMSAIKPLWLQSISGGTDIIGCFGIGSPLKPVRRGAVQCRSLGYDVRVFNGDGQAVVGSEGELVCVAPAPSMPICFLDDRDGASYRSAYFDEYPAVWRHGDFVTLTAEGDLIFLGRSDATLKPAGVRVATADIYAALERVPLVVQSMAVGYSPPGAQSEKVILFVVLANGSTLDEALCNEIRRVLRESNAFYVPALILQAPQLPRTTNSKLSEISVKRALAGKDPGNLSALANPESLSFFLCEGLRAVRTALG